MKPVSRRALLGVSPLLAACETRRARYFGKTDPPRSQELVYLLGAEPGTLDPAKSGDLWESPVIHAMFDGLTSIEPATGEPRAALATHYEADSNGLRYVFRLRGHPRPRGIAFAAAEGSGIPARWSDGRPITAQDFVYSWRRAVDPATAAPYAYLFHYIVNGEAIAARGQSPETLAVRAVDEFSVEVELESPLPYLMRLLATKSFFATPQNLIESASRRGAGSSWIQPGNMVTSGAFTLREWRPYERIVLARNPAYYDAGSVSLEHIRFLPVADGSASANLYRAGEAALCMPMSPHLMAGISGMRDVRKCPNFGAHFPVMNTRKPPFNDVRVRYALNMATDKHAIAAFFGDGRTPLKGVVPPLDGYEPAKSLPVVMDGTSYDILSYNPEASRSLLMKAGYGPGLKFEYLYPAMPEFKPVAEILQQQWRKNLGIELALRSQEVQAWGQTVLEVAYNGVAAWAEIGGLEDPTWFLDMFRSPSTASGTGWTDRHYDDLLAGAKAITHAGQRLRKLAECERFLLQAMPCLPLYTDVWVYLCKPFLKGITGDPFHGRMFNNARIDTNWRPS